MKLLYGTGNPAKLDAMRHRLAGLGIELIGLKDLGGVKQPEIIEDGKTPLENARKKVEAYFNALHMPVFSCDSGLYFDNVAEDDQPGVHVRTVNGTFSPPHQNGCGNALSPSSYASKQYRQVKAYSNPFPTLPLSSFLSDGNSPSVPANEPRRLSVPRR